ncbi:helix-turn-helix domain-containing protein [Mycobacterium sp. M1]|uniref:Helix-turn-helix domain-containing protein n=1 Tax=Mycolicibacter acidiphilus TaxID=2835306 RepID=A0ABS5RGM0_9MYCO|nr:helix-turn-helix domain-containing protein [Mycolicibacter acidiphilus]MBS9532611.1 helix-turn-helix domain-containing protein [Mycolicibacter acidiphilus]
MKQIAPPLRGLLNRKEAAVYLGCSTRRVDDLRRAGFLPARLDGREWKYTCEDLNMYIDALPRNKALA